MKDQNWYCMECGKKKEDYEAMYCDYCWGKLGVEKQTTIERKANYWRGFRVGAVASMVVLMIAMSIFVAVYN